MSTYIDKLRRLVPKGKISGGDRTSGAEDIPLDHRLTFSPQKDEKWTFDERNNHILYNEESVGEMIKEGANDVGTLCELSQGLYDYQQFVWSKGGKSAEKFNGTVISLEDTILGRLGSIYDGLTGGVRFEYDGSSFWLNNVNICTVLKLYNLRPTEKARHYLMGLRDKLGLILSKRQDSTRYDGILDRAKGLFDEITVAIEYIPTDAPCRLVAGRRSA